MLQSSTAQSLWKHKYPERHGTARDSAGVRHSEDGPRVTDLEWHREDMIRWLELAAELPRADSGELKALILAEAETKYSEGVSRNSLIREKHEANGAWNHCHCILTVSRTKAAPRYLGVPGHTLVSADLCRHSTKYQLGQPKSGSGRGTQRPQAQAAKELALRGGNFVVHLKIFLPAARFSLWRSGGTRSRAALLYIPMLKTAILGP
ncbi:hypothetical protein B0H13DRAFT_1890791 [Mycena leptocephala]|nr:hypothetical protein B0H13DRAFT_1890791 [Mycena leptocephala]